MSWAYVQAIAAQAGILILRPSEDYGVDGSFRSIKQRGSRRVMEGVSLDFQLKATASANQYRLEPEAVVYKLEVKTYNDLLDRLDEGGAPFILLLMTLGSLEQPWVAVSETELRMRACCYYVYLKGKLSSGTRSVTIRIPRTQRLTPEALVSLMKQVKQGLRP